jgi:hypothetical protein
MSQTRSDSRGARRARALDEWRRRRLTPAGFEPGLTAQLAVDADVDLHELLVLLDRGCPPALAARILAPLERGRSGC